MQSVGFGNGKFVAIGVYGCQQGCSGDLPNVTLTSPDGFKWQLHSNDLWNGVASILYSAGTFVAVNANGIANRVIISGDGAHWSPAPLPFNLNLECFYLDVAYGNGRFVAVGDRPGDLSALRTNILYSLDGVSWSSAFWGKVQSGYTAKPATIAVAFGNGYFLSISRWHSYFWPPLSNDVSEVRFSTMTNGPPLLVPWTPLDYLPNDNAPPQPFPPFNDMAFGNGVFVLAGTNVLVVTNQTFAGNNTLRTLPVTPPTTNAIQKIIFADGRFVAAAGAEILSSPDGVTWQKHATLATETGPKYIGDIAFGNGRFVAAAGTNFFVSPSSGAVAERPGGQLRLTGATGYVHRVEASETLTSNSWQVVTNITLTNSSQLWTDPQGANLPRRFYRTRLLP